MDAVDVVAGALLAHRELPDPPDPAARAETVAAVLLAKEVVRTHLKNAGFRSRECSLKYSASKCVLVVRVNHGVSFERTEELAHVLADAVVHHVPALAQHRVRLHAECLPLAQDGRAPTKLEHVVRLTQLDHVWRSACTLVVRLTR